jgi:tetratricopeptide (TPR) repeat protein
MRGRALFDWGNPQDTFQSISFFEKAVEVDPDYVMAWGYLAFAQGLSMIWQSFDDASPAAITAYERALALDPEQSEALAVKALMTQILEHDWETAGKLYQRAMASRDNAVAMSAYAMFYLQQIEEEERAIQLYAEAEKRDPLNAGYKANLAHLLLVSGDAEAASQKAREALELNPQHNIALMTLIEAYTVAGNYAAVQQVLENIPSALQQWPAFRVRAGLYHLAIGDHHKAGEIYREYIDNPPIFGSMATATLALSLGEVEEAIDLMEHEVENNSWTQFWIRSSFRQNDTLKNYPRFLALLKRIGLDDESVAALHRKISFD